MNKIDSAHAPPINHVLKNNKIEKLQKQISTLMTENKILSSVSTNNNEQNELQAVQFAHNITQQKLIEEKAMCIELKQALNTLQNKIKSTQTLNEFTVGPSVEYDYKIKIKSLEDTIHSLKNTKNSEIEEWREEIVCLHEKLLQANININRYKLQFKELKDMYAECIDIQTKNESAVDGSGLSADSDDIQEFLEYKQMEHHRMHLLSMDWKKKFNEIQEQTCAANEKWKNCEIKYQLLLTEKINLNKVLYHL